MRIPGFKWARLWASMPRNSKYPPDQRYDTYEVKPHRRKSQLVQVHWDTGRWKYYYDLEWRDCDA